MTVKRCILGTLAGVLFALGVYFIVDAVLAYEGAASDTGGGTLTDWLFGLIMRRKRNELLFDLCDAIWFFRFIPALAIFDLLFCMGEKRYSVGMFGVSVALCALLVLSLAAEPPDVYARKYLLEGSLSIESTLALTAAVGACKLAALGAMAGLASAYIVLKRKSRRQ